MPNASMMSALVYEAPRVMTMRAQELPVLGSHEALIRVAFSGICGSELSGFLGQSSIRQPPLVFGHEVSGHVAAIGDAVAGLAVGTAVTVNPLISCGHCRYCEVGRQQLCPKRLLLGASLPGSNAEYVIAPAASVLPLPDGMDLAAAAMVEPVAFALNAVALGQGKLAANALVVGAGAIGLFILQVLAESGVQTRYVVDRNPSRLAMAVGQGCIAIDSSVKPLGDSVRELTADYGVDVAFDAVGTPDTRRDCVASVAAGGTVVLAGLHSDLTELSINTLIRSEITLAGAFAYTPANFATALEWLSVRRVGLRDGIVKAPLSAGQHWYERLVQGDPAAKVLLQP